jgi:hypothetical protein
MGSYFKRSTFEDIDLVVVVDCQTTRLMESARLVRDTFCDLEQLAKTRLDLTIFTPSEFSSAPLRDMATLEPLYERASVDDY